MTPTPLSMVPATSSGEERESDVSAWTATGGLMVALGPVVGGAARRDQLALGGLPLVVERHTTLEDDEGYEI
jgi:hypothetical protein